MVLRPIVLWEMVQARSKMARERMTVAERLESLEADVRELKARGASGEELEKRKGLLRQQKEFYHQQQTAVGLLGRSRVVVSTPESIACHVRGQYLLCCAPALSGCAEISVLHDQCAPRPVRLLPPRTSAGETGARQSLGPGGPPYGGGDRQALLYPWRPSVPGYHIKVLGNRRGPRCC